ncbi:MAG: amidohydrolase family protein [Bacillota bacterium]
MSIPTECDLLLTGGPVRLPGGATARALAIGGGKILAAGSEATLAACRTDRTRVIDLAGRIVVPGLADSHLHLIATGQLLTQVDCTRVRTKADLLAAVSRRAAALPAGAWVVGRGWSEAALDRLPSPAELEGAAGGRPVFLVRVCGHAALINGAALALAGIGPDWQPGPEVERDVAGEPAGLIHESAVARVRAAVPPPTEADLADALRAGIRRAAAAGLTQVHTEDMRYIGGRTVAFLLDLYRRVLAEEGYPLRVLHLFYHPHLPEVQRKKGCQGRNPWRPFASGEAGAPRFA